LAQDEKPERASGEARSRRGLDQQEPEVMNDRPWRLADLSFVPSGNGREKATINGVEVMRENGRYWIITPNGPLWSNIDFSLQGMTCSHALSVKRVGSP
jgi:hypothetical protein